MARWPDQYFECHPSNASRGPSRGLPGDACSTPCRHAGRLRIPRSPPPSPRPRRRSRGATRRSPRTRCAPPSCIAPGSRRCAARPRSTAGSSTPGTLAAVLEGLRLRMEGALRTIDRSTILAGAEHALALHRWLVAPDFDEEGEVQRAETHLTGFA